LFTVLIAVGQWRSIFFLYQYNHPDESQMLAGAMKFSTDLMPWRSVDGGTGGPVVAYALLFVHWLGIPFGYPLARVTAIICIAVYVIFLFLAFRRMSGTAVAAFCITPLALFYANPAHPDFVQYTSELATLTEMGVLLWLVSGFDWTVPHIQVIRAVGIGALGMVIVMSKAQALPIAVMATFVFVYIRSASWRQWGMRVGIAGLSACAFLVFIVIVVISAGAGSDMKVFFIYNTLIYESNTSLLDFSKTINFIYSVNEIHEFAVTTTILTVAALILPISDKSRYEAVFNKQIFIMLLIASSAYISIAGPGRVYPHYLNYFTIGAILVLFIACMKPRSFSFS
jgi:hypothetical protein